MRRQPLNLLTFCLLLLALLAVSTAGCDREEQRLRRLHGTWTMTLMDMLPEAEEIEIEDSETGQFIDVPPEMQALLDQLRIELVFLPGGELQLVSGEHAYSGRWTAPVVGRDEMTLVTYFRDHNNIERRMVEQVRFVDDNTLELIDDDGERRRFRRLHGGSSR